MEITENCVGQVLKLELPGVASVLQFNVDPAWKECGFYLVEQNVIELLTT